MCPKENYNEQDLGGKDKALKAYKTVVEDFPYARAWDPKGWYWTVADAASPRIKELEGG